jgi:hypothetical protein
VWPEIKNLVSAGHSLKDIWTWLNEIGLDIGYAHLSYCIAQLRQQDRAAQAPIQDLLLGLRPVPPEQTRLDQPASQAEPSPNEHPIRCATSGNVARERAASSTTHSLRKG